MSEHLLERAEPVILVALGGFAGAVARHATSVVAPAGFPWGTLAVNVLGSFCLGVLVYESVFAGRLPPETRLVVGTGFLSSFTTYSTFALETVTLTPTLAAVNVVANYGLGLVAVIAGRHVAGEFA